MNKEKNRWAPNGAFVMSEERGQEKSIHHYITNDVEDSQTYDWEYYDDRNCDDLAAEVAKCIWERSIYDAERFLGAIEDMEVNTAYRIITEVYKEQDRSIPLVVQSFAEDRNTWDSFCVMVGEELALICECADLSEMN